MALDPQEIRTVRVRQRDRGLSAAVALAVVFVLVALLKPWDLLGLSDAPRASSAPAAADRSSPRASPGLLPGRITANSTQCYYTSGWRVYSRLPSGSRNVRSWSAVQPVRAQGPEDERIVMTRLVADSLPVLGYCAPLVGRERPPDAVTTSAWQLLDDGSMRRLDLEAIEGANPTDLPTQAVYLPPMSAMGSQPGAWLPGRYVFRIGDRSKGRYERWFGVEIVPPSVIAAGGPDPQPSPSTSPSPTPGGG